MSAIDAPARQVTVRVPAAPRGAATVTRDRWLVASFALDDARALRVERGGLLRSLAVEDADDALIAGVAAACAEAGVAVPDALRCRVVSNIPIGAGLGASAAAAIAGVVGARALLRLALDDGAAERIAASVDGSPSQVRAAFAAHTSTIREICQ